MRECLVKVEGILDSKDEGDQLSSIEVHDIVCHIADAVLAGGIRRAALISLFSADDQDMLSAKSGNWWETNPQRGRANNSVVIMRHRIDKPTFLDLWDRVKQSGAGEPGFYFTNDKDYGCNPCCEIALRPFQFCNLTEINVSDVETQPTTTTEQSSLYHWNLASKLYRFHYLRPVWQRNTKKITNWRVHDRNRIRKVLELDMNQAAVNVRLANAEMKKIGIKPAARCTTVKPAGTTS